MEEYVLKGVVLLDSKLPGWEDHIDWDTLDIWSVSKCIIGQLNQALDIETFDVLGFEGGYVEGRQYGFDVPDPAKNHYEELNTAWQDWHKHHRMHV